MARLSALVIAALLAASAAPALAQGNTTTSATGTGRDDESIPGKVEVGVGTTDEVTTGNSGPDEPGTRAAGAGGTGGGAERSPAGGPACDALADPAARERCRSGG